MRILTFLLFLLVPILGVWTFVAADQYGWWFPENVSTYGDSIDGLFNLILWMVGITFVGTEVLLCWCVIRYTRGMSIAGQRQNRWLWLAALPLGYLFFAQWGRMNELLADGEYIRFMMYMPIGLLALTCAILAETGATDEGAALAREAQEGKSIYTHGNHTLELWWTAIPAGLLLIIAFSQMGAWKEVKFDDQFPSDGAYTIETPMAQVYASQFDWRVRYPDAQGDFEGADVLETPFEFRVPVDTDVVFHLKSRDVLHSFFVPNFRLKQDAVPGMTIPMWFNSRETGEFDLICAELCGWGHYKMAGRIVVMEKDDYEAWLANAREELYSNGLDDLEVN